MNSPNQSPSFSGSLFFSCQQDQDTPFTSYLPNHFPTSHNHLTTSCRQNQLNLKHENKRIDNNNTNRLKGTKPKLQYLRTLPTLQSFEHSNQFMKKQHSCYFEPLDTSLHISDQEDLIEVRDNNPEVSKKYMHFNKTLKYINSQHMLTQSYKCNSLGFTFSLQSTESEETQTQRANKTQIQPLLKPPCLNKPIQSSENLLKLQLSEQLLQKQTKYRELIRCCTKQHNPYYKQFLKTRMRTLLDQLYTLKKLLRQH